VEVIRTEECPPAVAALAPLPPSGPGCGEMLRPRWAVRGHRGRPRADAGSPGGADG